MISDHTSLSNTLNSSIFRSSEVRMSPSLEHMYGTYTKQDKMENKEMAEATYPTTCAMSNFSSLSPPRLRIDCQGHYLS